MARCIAGGSRTVGHTRPGTRRHHRQRLERHVLCGASVHASDRNEFEGRLRGTHSTALSLETARWLLPLLL
jgi:hypothetical protein